MQTEVPPMSIDEAINFDLAGSFEPDKEKYQFDGQLTEFSPAMTLRGDGYPAQYSVVADIRSWDDAEAAATILNRDGAPNLVADHAALTRRVLDARAIIAGLLLVLHDHTGSKRRIANKARTFLGLAPGAKVGSFEDKMEVKYGIRI